MRRISWPHLLLGLLFVLSFFGLSETEAGTWIAFIPNWSNSNAGELNSWLGFLLFLTPGGLLIGWSVSGLTATSWRRLADRLDGLAAKEQFAFTVIVFLFTFVLANFLHHAMLLGYPATDDENSTRVGGQLLAMGRITMQAPTTWAVEPHLFLPEFARGITSLDFLGPQIAWAFAELTGTGNLIFSIAAGLAPAFVLLTVARCLGFRWGVAAGLLAVLSPMGLMLSGTTHSHLLSKALLAASFWCYVSGGPRAARRWDYALGLLVGAAALCRMYEIVALGTPFAAKLVLDAIRRGRPERIRLAAVLAGFSGPMILFLLHNFAVTGDALVAPRMAGRFTAVATTITDGNLQSYFWSRFGGNTAYNLQMLCIWFLGPVGIALVLKGLAANSLTKLLGIGVGLHLALTLFHGNGGLHIVGPIHYSDAQIPLLLISMYGLHQYLEGGMTTAPWWHRVAPTLGLGLLLSLGMFSMHHAKALQRQAEIHETIFERLQDPKFDDSVVIAPHYMEVWTQDLVMVSTATFVYEWPPNHPSGEGRVVLLLDSPETLALARARYPERRIFWLQVIPGKARRFIEVYRPE